jgi:hypothetical protein
VPNGFELPLCHCQRPMGFFRFCEDNHSCDTETCLRVIPHNSYAWHCPYCNFDICTVCAPYDWTPVNSFTSSSLPDSAATLELDSPPSSQAALRLQASADAAALSRGHNA